MNVKSGDHVKKGETLLVMSAMKMEVSWQFFSSLCSNDASSLLSKHLMKGKLKKYSVKRGQLSVKVIKLSKYHLHNSIGINKPLLVW